MLRVRMGDRDATDGTGETRQGKRGRRARRRAAAPVTEAVARALEAHDRVVAASGLTLWVGGEPTYTDPRSEDPQWLHAALGGDKHRRAAALAARLAAARPGAALLRSVGRPYPGEPCPRWCFGVYALRDGAPAWSGPPDPLCAAGADLPPDPETFLAATLEALAAVGWPAAVVEARGTLALRLVFRFDGAPPARDPAADPRLLRGSLHETAWQGAEPADALSAEGVGLLLAGVAEDSLTGRAVLRVELPAVPDVAAFRRLLGALAEALTACGLGEVVLAGHPPPTDASVAWLTVTPDPAVVEVNMAPVAGACAFHHQLEAIHAAAAGLGLAGYRLHYNGLETDSGGGGQITLGGPAPRSSPFFVHPALLPGLVRYVNRHPALSYCWAPEATGVASQGPRADEGLRESLRELDLALALLVRHPGSDPSTLQAALAPFLADASGNAHRSELNVEKLWSERLGARGRLGLVEFRSLRMAPEPAQLSARVALLRSIAAMVSAAPPRGPLVDWGDALHDRFSLPFYLRTDLREVLAELQRAGLGLGPVLESLLLEDEARRIATVSLPGITLELSRAVEFWPLLGDVASQEQGGSRLVDPSTTRLEVRLQDADPERAPAGWQVSARGVALPLCEERDERGPCLVAGVRYRAFVPAKGLHPSLPAQSPLTLRLAHPAHGAHQVVLHEWRPGGGAYDGLPGDRAEAAARRAERCVHTPAPPAPPPVPAPEGAAGVHVLDLRWLEALGPG
jgi:uncharacterized protein (DUF2126 family)